MLTISARNLVKEEANVHAQDLGAGIKTLESKVSLRGGSQDLFSQLHHFIGMEPKQIMVSSECGIREKDFLSSDSSGDFGGAPDDPACALASSWNGGGAGKRRHVSPKASEDS